jgi:hypothetical protein
MGIQASPRLSRLLDARPATAERGRRYLDGLVDLLVAYFDAWCSPR